MEAKLNNITLKLEKTDFISIKITGSGPAYNQIRQFYFDDLELFESFFILLVNRGNQTTGYVKISQGGTAGTVVDPKIVAKYAIDSLAAGVILAHNHPSGNIQPSESDKAITNKIRDGLKLFDITTLDHIILGGERYFSFADEGLL